MAPKRPIDAVHPSRRDQVPSQSRKRQKPDNLGSKSFKKAHPVNALKSKVRDISRLLAKDGKLPAQIRIAKERELQNTQFELQQSQRAERRSKMIGKYHQVRFFDRQKATKRLKRARKKLIALHEADGTRHEVQQEVHVAEICVNYAMYYPLDKPYCCLFPSQKNEKDDEEEAKDATAMANADQAIWNLVEQCMSDGRLKDLREGLLTEQHKDPAITMSRTSARSEKLAADTNDNDKDSDGGFFE